MAAVSYVIKPGDTLSGIALEFCGNAYLYPALAALNNIANPNLIYSGDTLTVDCDALHGWSAANPAGSPIAATTSPAQSKSLAMKMPTNPTAPAYDPNDPALSVGSTDAIDPSIPKLPGT